MTVSILLFRRKLRKRLPQIGKIKYRIVAKPSVTPRRLQNHSIHAIADNGHRLPALHKRNHANKISRPLRPALPAQFRQAISHSAPRCWPQVPRTAPTTLQAPRPAPAPQVPNRPQTQIHRRRSRIVQRLAQRILRKRRRIFLKRGQGIEPRRQLQLNRRAQSRQSAPRASARNSPSFPGLEDARYNLTGARTEFHGQYGSLLIRQPPNPCRRERQQILHLAAIKRPPFRRRLNFHEVPAAGHHHVHVHFRARIFFIRQVEQRTVIHNPNARRRNGIDQRRTPPNSRRHHALKRQRQRHKRAGDRRRPRSPIRLNDIAIDPDGSSLPALPDRSPRAAIFRSAVESPACARIAFHE